MSAGYVLNIERLYGPGIIRAAAAHNLRQIAAEIGAGSHIDAARIADNFILRGPGTAKEVAALAKSLMEAAGVTKCRKGAVTALELLFTLPAATTINPRLYFEQAMAWAEQHFGVPVLSCVQHADEGSPHAHALLLPLVDGRMGGSDLHGGKAKLAAMQTSFHEAVGAPHGLPKYVPQKRLSAPVRTAAMALIREKLQTNAALNDEIIDALLVPHAKDPVPLMLKLGIPMPMAKPKGKDFVSIMTAVCKSESRKPIGKAKRSDVWPVVPAAPETSLPDFYVGKAPSIAPIPSFSLFTNSATSATSTHPVNQHQATTAPVQPIDAGHDKADRQPTGPALQDNLHHDAPAANRTEQAAQHHDASAVDQVATTTTRQRASSTTASASPAPGKRTKTAPTSASLLSGSDALKPEWISPAPSRADQSAENLAQCDSPKFSGQEHSPEYFGQLQVDQQAGHTTDEEGRHAAPAHGQHLVPVPGTASTTTAPQAAPAHAAGPDRRQTGSDSNTSRNGHISEDIPKTGDTPTAAGGDPLKTEQVDHHGKADFQRQRDDDHLAEHWDADRGEFVTVPSASARPPGHRSRAPYSARASPADIALDSIHELLALAGTTEHHTPAGQGV